jgi:hypothetical protein
MPAKKIKQPQERSGNKSRKSGNKREPVHPDEMISEINQQSTALQKIVSRFLDPVAEDGSEYKKKA